MPYEILIRRNSTGEVRVVDLFEETWSDFEQGMWTRGYGNYGLDVNRHLMFVTDDAERNATWPQEQMWDYDAFVRWSGGRVRAIDRRPPGRANKAWPKFAYKPLDLTGVPPYATNVIAIGTSHGEQKAHHDRLLADSFRPPGEVS